MPAPAGHAHCGMSENKTTLKDLCLTQLETAFGETLTKLVGRPCAVHLHELKIHHDAMPGLFSRQVADVAGQLEIKTDEREMDIFRTRKPSSGE